MIPTLIIIALALVWLLIETDYMRVKLPVGKELPRYGVGRTMAQWEEYNKAHEKELEKERKEYTERQAVIKSHTCPLCRTTNDNLLIETKTIIAGNSTCHITGCLNCLEKYSKEITKAQTEKPQKQSYGKAQPLLFITQEHIGSHKQEIGMRGGRRHYEYVDDYKTVFHDCLTGKEWLEAHYKDEYPEPMIELSVDGKNLSVNGDYKKGMIAGFMGEFTHKVRAGKKTMTVQNGDSVVNCGGGVYVAMPEDKVADFLK